MTIDFKQARARFARAEGPLFWSSLAAGAFALGMASGAVSNALATPRTDPRLVMAALKERLPRTPVSAVACRGLGDLCEVVAGRTLFYVDRSARYLVIGRVYDMEARADLTAARLLELDPDLLASGAPRAAPGAADDEQGPPEPSNSDGATRVNPAELPKGGAIRWGPARGPRLIVLSDFACGYCRKLTAELKKIGARVEERPISIFGASSRAAAERVLCAPDPAAALHAAYDRNVLPARRRCDTSGLDGNEAFARRHGLAGTPVLIRPSDGAVLQGFRPAASLEAFAKGGRP